MEKYTLALTIVMFDYISHTQAGLFDKFLKPNQGLDPMKELNPLYQMNKAEGAFEEAVLDNRDRNDEDNRVFWLNLQSKPRYQGFSDTEITTHKTNLLETVKEALMENRENNQQNKRGFWGTSQTKPFNNTEIKKLDDDKIAQLFPQGVDLLNKLQELNKLKEEGKLPIANKPTTPIYRPEDTNKKEEVTILKPNKVNESKVLKPLTKKKFYYQVQPVIPDNERRDVDETIYYIDL